MTSYKQRASEVLEAGRAERGNFEPTGAPKRIYSYWLDETNSRKGRDLRRGDRKENFCHFWRVVAIWAPLMFLRRKVEAALTNGYVLALLGVAALVGLITMGVTFSEFGQIMLGTGATVLLMAALVLGIYGGWSDALRGTDQEDSGHMRAENARWTRIALPFYALGYLAGRLERVGLFLPISIGTALLSVTVFIGFILFSAVSDFGFWSVALNIAIFAGLAALVGVALLGAGAGLVALGEWVSGKRALARKRAEAKRAEAEPVEPKAPREPTALDRWLTNLGDMLVFFAQVVRTKKWKICPTVEVK